MLRHKTTLDKLDLVECGSCEGYHRRAFTGDCRDDYERYPDPENICSYGITRDEETVDEILGRLPEEDEL